MSYGYKKIVKYDKNQNFICFFFCEKPVSKPHNEFLKNIAFCDTSLF